jgi:hypothetical protein
MANVDAPSGCRVVGTKSGYYEGQLTKMYIPATDTVATFVGDVVKLAGSADADGVPTIAQAAAGDTPCGIIEAFEIDGNDLNVSYRKASTAKYALVNTDPNVLFEIQEDSVGGALGAANVGQNASIVVGTGATTSGLSGMELDSNTAATTSTLVLHIEGLVPRADNAIGTNAKYLCSFNVHQFGSVGVAGV